MAHSAAALAVAALNVVLSSTSTAPESNIGVRVTGLDATSALVVLHGGIARKGRWFHWVPLLRRGDGWSTVLRAPGLYGVYPVLLRVGGVPRSTGATVSVVPPGFSRQPGFDTPNEVAQWWGWIGSQGVVVRNVSRWRSGFYTHRDPHLNQLLRINFQLPGAWPAMRLSRGEHTLFLSIARVREGGLWRLLEVVRSP